MKKDCHNINDLTKKVSLLQTAKSNTIRDNILKCYEKELRLALNIKFEVTDNDARDTLIKMFLIEDATKYNNQELIKNTKNSDMILNKFMDYCEKQYVRNNVTLH